MFNQYLFKNPSPKIIVALVTLTLLILAIGILWSDPWGINPSSLVMLRSLTTVVSVPVLLLGFHYRQALTARWQAALAVLMLATIFGFSLNGAWIIYKNIIHPPEWDFLVFWLDGQVAIEGLTSMSQNPIRKYHYPFLPATRSLLRFLRWAFGTHLRRCSFSCHWASLTYGPP